MRKWLWILLLAIPLLMAGCRKQQQVDESGYRIWYINQDETCLKYENKELQSKNEEGLLREMMEVMRETPTDDELKPVIPEDVELLDFDFEHNQLYLDFSPEYKKMPKVYEVLCRAAIVRTLGQIDGVEYVDFQVNGEPLTDLEGKEIGLMNEDQFIENAGEEINAYKTADLTLYFSNKAGDKLVGQRVAMEYNSNISLEKLIVEQLIAGPPFEGAYPTIPSETKLLNISIKDNICYVNLDEGFLGTGYNVIESIPVYSIVNSLIENTDAQKVQISINGETNRMFRESINFDTIFEKNEGLIEQ
ncbi:MAG: GerMN domain-containing protein [Candidatus Choladocola sp.]|nr:GerMN domain-containing protein [Clostridiaceae bacterium]MDY4547295.1 GerMN domain-containing protein [Candidatus Choladocola sp.]